MLNDWVFNALNNNFVHNLKKDFVTCILNIMFMRRNQNKLNVLVCKYIANISVQIVMTVPVN